MLVVMTILGNSCTSISYNPAVLAISILSLESFDTKNDLAVLMYTGGTTGLPKGAMLSHFNLVANCYQCEAWIPGTEPGKEATVGALPFSHIFGLTTMMLVAIKLGAKCILIPDPKDIPDLISNIVNNKGTLFSGVNTLFNKINNDPKAKKFDLSCLNSALSGAGPLALDVQEKFEKSSKRQKELLEIMNDKLLDFSQKVNKIKTDINREMFIIENKLSEERVNYQKDMDMQYRDLTRKIVDIENKLNKIKKTVGAGLGITEERLNKIETELGIFTNFKEDEEAA